MYSYRTDTILESSESISFVIKDVKFKNNSKVTVLCSAHNDIMSRILGLPRTPKIKPNSSLL